jgi:hypothetical protein
MFDFAEFLNGDRFEDEESKDISDLCAPISYDNLVNTYEVENPLAGLR